MKSKSEVLFLFQQFKSLVENQFPDKIKFLRTDGEGEYCNHTMVEYLAKANIIHQTTFPYTPQQNGVVERKHYQILNTIRALFLHSGLPYTFWVDTLHTTTYLINRLPSTALHNTTPYQKLYNKTPNYTILHIFGCLCYPHLIHNTPHKFAPRSKPCIFLGYSTTKGYKCFDPDFKRIIFSHHVEFWESALPYKSPHPTSSLPTQNTITNSTTPPLLLVPSTHSSQQHSQSLPTTTSPSTSTTILIPTQSHSPLHTQLEPTLQPSQPTCNKHYMITRQQTGSL